MDHYLDFEQLKDRTAAPPFTPGALATAEQAPELALPPPPSGMAKLMPGARAKHEKAVETARSSHKVEMDAYDLRERGRETALSRARGEHEGEVAQFEARLAAQHDEVDELRERFERGDPAAIVEYFLARA